MKCNTFQNFHDKNGIQLAVTVGFPVVSFVISHSTIKNVVAVQDNFTNFVQPQQDYSETTKMRSVQRSHSI